MGAGVGPAGRQFRATPDSAFTTEVNDIDDLATRLLNHLLGRAENRLVKPPAGTILLARDLTPSQAASFDRSKVIGFATDLGGRTRAHRDRGPCTGHSCRGRLPHPHRGRIGRRPDHPRRRPRHHHPQPRPGTAENTRADQAEKPSSSLWAELRDLPSVTSDGEKIELVAGNIEFADEASHVLELGGEGVGLYRTEFLYLTGKGRAQRGRPLQELSAASRS